MNQSVVDEKRSATRWYATSHDNLIPSKNLKFSHAKAYFQFIIFVFPYFCGEIGKNNDIIEVLSDMAHATSQAPHLRKVNFRDGNQSKLINTPRCDLDPQIFVLPFRGSTIFY